MNKQQLIKEIIGSLENDLQTIIDAAKDAHETATHEETAAKSKYDTFALEASYLAHGQSKRAQEIMQSIETYRHLNLPQLTNNDTVVLGALIHLKSETNEKVLFLGPRSGGVKVEFDEKVIVLITPESPLAKQLIGASLGDCVLIGNVEFELVNIQ